MKTVIKTHVLYEDGVAKVDVYKVDGYMKDVTVIIGDDEVSLYNKSSIKTLHDLLGTVLEREFD